MLSNVYASDAFTVKRYAYTRRNEIKKNKTEQTSCDLMHGLYEFGPLMFEFEAWNENNEHTECPWLTFLPFLVP